MTEDISKKLSCGVLVVDSNDKLLLLHVTGQDFWDIPKGTQEEFESPIFTAIREMEEESGIIAREEDLIEIGWCEYNRFKDLWLYILLVEDIDLSMLKCRSTFTDKYDEECPEIDRFQMVSLDDAPSYMCASLKRLYNSEVHQDIIRNNGSKERINLQYK
jgi:8-oxo-dGTP pyrophosphatase MutT (NUDIX family)